MKQLVVVFLSLALVFSAEAQNKTIVGKWMLSSFSGDGLSVDLENPTTTRKALAEQLKAQMGTEPDSSMIELTYQMLVPTFNAMSVTFTSDGKAIYQSAGKNGQVISDTASYTADFTKGILTTVIKTGGEEIKEVGAISFENELLVIRHEEKGEIIKMKRVK